MQEYVLGFMFSDDLDSLLLIRKQRPVWQAGRLNGVGGKVEAEESPLYAMIREFREETGVAHTDWVAFQVLEFPGARVTCFAAASSNALLAARSTTDEPVCVIAVGHVPEDPVMGLATLVPLAAEALSQSSEAA